MIDVLVTEFRKTRRSTLFIVLIVASAFPALFDLAQALIRGKAAAGLPLQNLGLWSLGAFVTLVMATVQAFSAEYQGNTIQVIFATPRPAAAFLFAKLLVGACFVAASIALSLGFGFLFYSISGAALAPAQKIGSYLGSVALAAIQFVLLVPYAALIAILCRKAFPAILINLAVFVLFFPFGMTKWYYLVPPLIPVTQYAHALAASGIDRGAGMEGWVSIGAFSAACLGFCAARFRRG
jgi:ABC-type transport system involved in multi-copper enzyme maturation permease subunit